MNLEQLSKLKADLEKCLELLKKETRRDARMQLFSQFKQIYFQIRSETSEKSAS